MTLPSGWTHARLGEKCSIEIGGTPSRNNPAYWDEGNETTNVWVSIKDMNQRVITHTAEQISDAGIAHSNVKLQSPGTILLSFKLTIGRVAVAGLPLYTNEAIAGLRSTCITHDYLYYGLQQWNLLAGVDQAIKGATLNKEKLKKIEIVFPESTTEQTNIVHVLSSIDYAIARTNALIAKQQRIKTGLMQDLLTRGIDGHGRIRSAHTHEFQDSTLGQIPADWTAVRIGRAFSLQRGHDITESTIEPGPYPVVSSGGIIGYHSVATSRGPNVVVGRKGTIGSVRYVDSDFWAHDTSLYVTDFFGNDERFCYYLFSHLDLARFGTKSGSPSLNRNDVHPIWIGLPQLPEQRAIAARVLAADSVLLLLNIDLEKQKHLKTGLMQDLLTGRKRVTALLDAASETMAQVS